MSRSILHPAARGVTTVVATPFDLDERVDMASLANLVNWIIDRGVDGLLALGVLSEADRLNDQEREAVLALVLDRAAGRVPVVVGVTSGSTFTAVERSREAERLGAAGVLLSPPPLSIPARDHFMRVADAVSIPLIAQDHPASSGVQLSVELLAGLAPITVKVEAPPTAPKMTSLIAADAGISVIGGLGGMSLLSELDAGAVGTMTGFAFPELLCEIVRAHESGDRETAATRYRQALPLLVFEAQPGFGAAIRKEILVRRGAIASPCTRAPARELDGSTRRALARLLEEAPQFLDN
jgi:4-hydroxy-tetrahydrodipicolinate synthase